jgi:lycopene beta-cyclase
VTPLRRADVAIVGDGPAGAALARACRSADLDVVVVGPGAPWTNTYAAWPDELPSLPDDVWLAQRPVAVVVGDRPHRIERPYGVFDTERLTAHLLDGVEHVVGRAVGVEHVTGASRVVVDDGTARRAVAARLVVDASGARPVLARLALRRAGLASQSAVGVVVAKPPPGHDPGTAVLMDLRPAGDDSCSTFAYVVPVAEGWLVEETSLAARPAVGGATLRARLLARYGSAAVAGALRHEVVSIPMGLPLPSRPQPVVAFGAAASYIHPATGYSLTAALRAAPRVAAAIAAAPAGAAIDPRPVWEAVWPAEQRRVRALHDYGLAALLRMRPPGVREFFDAFFDLPVARWAPYLRVDATVDEVTAVMWSVFSAVSWRVRRQLAAGSPLRMARALR